MKAGEKNSAAVPGPLRSPGLAAAARVRVRDSVRRAACGCARRREVTGPRAWTFVGRRMISSGAMSELSKRKP